jgi:hypothetical protein
LDNNSKDSKPRSFFRFQLRTLFILVAVVALLTVAGIQVYERYHSFPISEAIDKVNASILNNSNEVIETPVTEEEVIRAIESKLPTLNDASEQVKSILRRIVSSRRIPERGTLDFFPIGHAPADGSGRIWIISLVFYTSEKAGYGLHIRETDHRTEKVKKIRKK